MKAENLVKLAGSVLGLAAYLYLLGGAVVWLHLATARLSGDGGLSVVDSRHLLLVGCRVAVFELIALGGVSVIVGALVGVAILRTGAAESGKLSLEQGWNELGTFLSIIGLAAALLGVAIGLSMPKGIASWPFLTGLGLGLITGLLMILRRPPENGSRLRRWIEGRTKRLWAVRGIGWILRVTALGLLVANLVVGVVVVPLLQGTILIAATALIYGGHFLTWPGFLLDEDGKVKVDAKGKRTFRGILACNGVWVAVGLITLVALAWVYTPPVALNRVAVYRGDEEIAGGAIVSRDGDTVLIAECDESSQWPRRSTRPRMQLVHLSEDERLEYRGGQYWFDPGDRPSLYQAFRAAFHESVPPHASAPLQHSLRGLHLTCGAPKEAH